MTEREREMAGFSLALAATRIWTADNPGQLKVIVARCRDSIVFAYVQGDDVAHTSMVGYN